MKSEWEQLREQWENEAIEEGAFDSGKIDHVRLIGKNITASVGLTPERVWALTRHMRCPGAPAVRDNKIKVVDKMLG